MKTLSTNEYKAGGLKHSFHGDIYQLKLLMFFLKCGTDEGYDFYLSTEWDAAEKFDDLVFKYTDNQVHYRFLQAKHKQDESQKIGIGDLLTTSKDGEFSLEKYFISYLKIKNNQKFRDGNLEDFIICTNIGLDLDDSATQLNQVSSGKNKGKKISVKEITSSDVFFRGVRYKFSNIDDMVPMLELGFKSAIQEEAEKLKDIGVLKGKIQKLRGKTDQNSKEELKKLEDRLEQNKTWKKEFDPIVDNKNQELEDNIKAYFKKLVFAVDQPNEVKLGNIINEKIGKEFKLLDADLVTDNFLREMLNWMKEKGGKFLTPNDCREFFEAVREKLDKLKISGPTSGYSEKLRQYNIEFKDSNLEEIRDFLTHDQKQILNLKSQHNTRLSAIKVNQALKGIQDTQGNYLYRAEDSYIFLSLDGLLRLKDKVLSAFRAQNTGDLLVIECKNEVGNIQNIYEKLKTIIDSNNDKKIILVTKDNNVLANRFKTDGSKYDEKSDDTGGLSCLEGDSQEEVLKKTVSFQGNDVPLHDLVDGDQKDVVDGEVLSKLIDNEKIRIGTWFIDPKYNDVQDYYVDRSLGRCVEIKKKFKAKDRSGGSLNKEELEKLGFIIADKGIMDVKEGQDIVLVSDLDKGFKELCNKYVHNVHWFKKEGSIWQKSQGSVEKLRKIVSNNERSTNLHKPGIIKDIDDKVAVIVGESGMGKSTLLTHLAVKTKKSDSSLWVVKINLAGYSSELKEAKFQKKEDAIKFLYSTVGFRLFKEEKKVIEKVLDSIDIENDEVSLKSVEEIKVLNLLEIKLFNNFYNKGKVVLLFDGFDEISPDYKEKTAELLKVLEDMQKINKMLVTTRLYNDVLSQLNKLNTFPYTLQPFSEEDLKVFVLRFWIKRLELKPYAADTLEEYYDALLRVFSQSITDQKRKFLNVPLQIQMVAEVLLDELKRSYDNKDLDAWKKDVHTFVGELNIAQLYKTFIEKKFRGIRFGEKQPNMNPDDPDIKGMLEREYKWFIKGHKGLAVRAIFQEDDQKILLGEEKKDTEEVNELIKAIKEGGEKTGIIEKIVNGLPVFAHRSYAEYFVVELICDRLNRSPSELITNFLLNTILKGEDHQLTRRFFNSKLVGDQELTELSSKDGYREMIGELLMKQERQTTLHIAAKEDLIGVVEFLLNSVKDNENKSEIIDAIDTEGYTSLHLAAGKGNLNIVDLLLENEASINLEGEDGCAPLHCAVQGNHLSIIRSLLAKGADVNLGYGSHYAPLHLAAENGHLDAGKLLLEAEGADLNCKDSNGYTPLHLAAGNGHLKFLSFYWRKKLFILQLIMVRHHYIWQQKMVT